MVTIEPPSFCSSITLNASRVTRNTPLARTALFFSQSARLVSAKAEAVASPALATTMSMPPNRSTVLPRRLAYRRLVGHVGTDGMDHVAARGLHQRPLGLGQGLFIDVGHHDAGTLGHEPARHRPADPAGTAGDQGHPPGQRLGLGQALQLRLLEQPVLDVERLLLGQADIAVDARRARA